MSLSQNAGSVTFLPYRSDDETPKVSEELCDSYRYRWGPDTLRGTCLTYSQQSSDVEQHPPVAFASPPKQSRSSALEYRESLNQTPKSFSFFPGIAVVVQENERTNASATAQALFLTLMLAVTSPTHNDSFGSGLPFVDAICSEDRCLPVIKYSLQITNTPLP